MTIGHKFMGIEDLLIRGELPLVARIPKGYKINPELRAVGAVEYGETLDKFYLPKVFVKCEGEEANEQR